MRKDWHGLRRLTGAPKEARLFTFDTETCADPWNAEQIGPHRFLFGTVYDGERFYDFMDRLAMAHFLCSGRWEGWQGWAVNLEYDLSTIFLEPTWPLYRTYFGGILKGARLATRKRERPSRGTDRKATRRSNEGVRLCDTLCQWRGDGEPGKRGGVAAYGRVVGLPKLDMPLAEIGPQITDRLRAYCQRDAEITWRMVSRMQDEYVKLGGTLKGSIASTALDLFRRSYLQPAHEHGRQSPRFLCEARRAYYGARTENFIVGRVQRVYVADVNSMYPSVMATEALPLLGASGVYQRLPDRGEGYAVADVEVPECEYPPLPFYWNKLYFPVGRWTGCFCLNELRYALACGVRLHAVHRAVVFPESAPVFADYVADLYGRRVATTDPVERLAFKTLMNALYGKFGQSGEILQVFPSWEEAGEPSRLGWRLHRHEGEPAPFANMIWAAYITAGARVRLHKLLVEYRALYCDTDSVFTRTRIEPAKELGALALKEVAAWADIRAPKVYATPSAVHIKGVRGADTIAEDGRYAFRKPTRFRESARRGMQPNTWHEALRVLNYKADKRHFFPDGSSRPLTVEEIQGRRRYRWEIGPVLVGDPEGKDRATVLKMLETGTGR